MRGDAQCWRLSWGRTPEQLLLLLLCVLARVAGPRLLTPQRPWRPWSIHRAAVAIFIVRPGDHLYRLVTESNASPSIKGGRVDATVKDTT